MSITGIVSTAILCGAVGGYGFDKLAARSWEQRPRSPGKLVDIGGYRLYATVRGTGGPTCVIESALGSASPEWWPLQDRLSQYTTVVTYDRAGYGWSDPAPYPRTSGQIAAELRKLLLGLHLPGPYILIGHSQGGLYLRHFARMYPKDTAGAVFLDPLSPDNDRFERDLSPKAFRGSGVDKSPGIRTTQTLGRLGLLRAMKPLLTKSPPFYYYSSLPKGVVEVLWQHFLFPKMHRTVAEEHRAASQKDNLTELTGTDGFPDVPLAVLYHSPQRMVDEIMKYGGLSSDEASVVEEIWQQLVKEYVSLSSQGRWVVADHSSHFIHLDQPEIVVQAVRNVLNANSR